MRQFEPLKEYSVFKSGCKAQIYIATEGIYIFTAMKTMTYKFAFPHLIPNSTYVK